MTATRNLLAYGLRVVRTGAFIDTTRDPILRLLSIGVEKLYKLTLGLMALDRHGSWPSKAEMRSWGHDLVSMHEAVMLELRARTTTKSQYVQGLLVEVDEDPVVAPVLRALGSYGRMGRFYYLDLLGDDPQAFSPEAAWRGIERAALADAGVARLRRRAFDAPGDSEVWELFIRGLHERIASAVGLMWTTVAVCGRNHALGETGVVFGFDVHPQAVGRQ